MAYKFTISTNNYSGYCGNIIFHPLTGGTIDLGSVILPYVYYTEYYYGQYVICIPELNQTCVLRYLPPPPTPTPTNTETPTPTPTNTETPTPTTTNTETPTPTPTQTETPTPTPTNTETPTPTPTQTETPTNTPTTTQTPTITPTSEPTTCNITQPKTFQTASQCITFNNISLSGSGNNNITLNSGNTISISFDYDVVYCEGGCPGCIVQHYIGLGGTSNQILCVNQTYGSGSVNSNITIPNTPGLYYIQYTLTLDYSCQPVIFNTNYNYAIACIEVLPIPTPTPTPSVTPTNTETPTMTPTPTNTETPTQTPTPTNTETPTNTQTPTNTVTPTPTPNNFLLQADGYYIQQGNGSKIIIT